VSATLAELTGPPANGVADVTAAAGAATPLPPPQAVSAAASDVKKSVGSVRMVVSCVETEYSVKAEYKHAVLFCIPQLGGTNCLKYSYMGL
jgi:hypothetical protein